MTTEVEVEKRSDKKGTVTSRRRGYTKWISDWRLLVMVLPATAFVVIFCYIPMYGITFSIRQLNLSGNIWFSPLAEPWHKYFNFLTDLGFWRVMRNTIIISSAKFVFTFPAPIVLALMINEIRLSWFKRTAQTISYLPHFVSWVIVVGLANQLLSIDAGPINKLIMALREGRPVDFLGTPGLFIPIIVASSVWKEVGWGTIIYLAAITGINPELYEAATVDGAGRWKQALYITLPGLMPTITIILVLAIPGIINAGFDQIYNFLNPIVMGTGDVIQTYVVRIGLEQGKYSLTTAVGLFNSGISVTLVLTANWLSKKLGGSGIW